ncbi:putative MFS transporter [Mollisia scopiformis]|uniref:Putative MFS transporter n=1 Tax=Mollisia scopiformis TaxID=149040 RepID=A0A194XQ56_MOLSC|nr:putative MFS transporter [Mollisia scopiformis]KUJ21877.1 putative MFS transporter [Mollisia scopiformis]
MSSEDIHFGVSEKSSPRPQDSSPDREPGILHDARMDEFGKFLVPTPTTDDLDPLNWPNLQKYTIVAIVCFSYFMLTYFTTAPVPSFTLLQVQFDATYSQVNWTFAIPALGLAAGPLFCSALADIYGRRVVMIVGTTIALISSGCTSIHGISFGGYLAARFFQGFGIGPAANVGLSIVNDISWEHERGFRVGLWAMSANMGTLVGGLVGGFLATVDQYWIAYHVTMLFAVLLVLELFFLPETLFPRTLVVSYEQNSDSQKISESAPAGSASSLKKTKQLGFLNFKKVPGIPHPKPYVTAVQFCMIWSYPTIVLSTLAYVFFHYWWICSVLTMEPAAYYNYKLQIQGLFFLGLIVGVVLAEIFCSGRLSDWIHGGERLPEMRLWLGYPAAVVSSIGLIVWVLSIDRQWHWITGQIAFFLYAAGLQIGNTVLSTYIVDNYPEHAMEVITFYTVIINMSAFINPWFINDWVEKSGYTWTFSAQAIICTFGIIPTYFVLQRYGPKLRRPMNLGFADHIDP